MAHVDSIYIHSSDWEKQQITAHVNLKPDGKVQVKFKVPDDFYKCLQKMAQHAADLHEQQMRAQILVDQAATASERGE